jgi:hypothetical protein
MDFIEKINKELGATLKYPAATVAATGVSLLVVFGLLWWNDVYQSPANVFWSMLNNNLAITSVTKHTSAQNSSGTLNQYSVLKFGSDNLVNQTVTLKQKNGTEVDTQSIGTTSAGYVKYTKITTNQKDKSGRAYNFSPILNVWGKTADKNSSLTHLFSTQTLDVLQNGPLPPVGDITGDQKGELMKFIQNNNVFSVDFKNVKRQTVDSQKAYVYTVEVDVSKYVQMMKVFAKDIGLHDLDSADPANYENSPSPALTLAVSPVSHDLIQATYPARNYTVSYSDYGAQTLIIIPRQTIAVSELQTRLQGLQ